VVAFERRRNVQRLVEPDFWLLDDQLLFVIHRRHCEVKELRLSDYLVVLVPVEGCSPWERLDAFIVMATTDHQAGRLHHSGSDDQRIHKPPCQEYQECQASRNVRDSCPGSLACSLRLALQPRC